MNNGLKTSQNFPEGTFFSVPLENGQFAVGIIARRLPNKGKYIGHFGYYWGPFPDLVTCKEELARLVVGTSRFKLICAGHNLIEGRWIVLEIETPWRREEWPFPDFYYVSLATNNYYRITLDENNITRVVFQELITDVQGLDMHRMSGADIAETHISRALGAIKEKQPD